MSEDTLQRDPMVWAAYGGCTDADPDLFFPEPGADTSAARAICRACPVRRMCLDHALETGQKFGIWGGMTENQLRRLRLRRHAARVEPSQASDHPLARPVRHLQLVR